ncbi:hypothetical protein GCM10010525_21900 [Glutamicibacter bergerei]|uniref:Uncharacterized protein n=1 Tax=Glutamicibacter ardleyensis TaxID=225894 RepID=A0ABQ2DNW8_9MICC|nr:hypothetical protein GCM10007173_26370 [Glutamicibacter ardleyensis]
MVEAESAGVLPGSCLKLAEPEPEAAALDSGVTSPCVAEVVGDVVGLDRLLVTVLVAALAGALEAVAFLG